MGWAQCALGNGSPEDHGLARRGNYTGQTRQRSRVAYLRRCLCLRRDGGGHECIGQCLLTVVAVVLASTARSP